MIASSPSMRLVALSLLVGSICPLVAVGAPSDVTDTLATNIRGELLSEYKFEAPPKDPVQPAPFVTNTSTQPPILPATPQDPNLVRMAPFIVRETAKMDALHAEVVAQEANARTEAITRRLGIGIHVAPMGPVGFYAVTAFYIPIQIGFGFSF
jgi:hypothetical protein